MIPNAAVKELQDIYSKHYGIELSADEAKDGAIRLLELFRAIFRPINNN
ncbi:MAG: hypothetical protein WC508_05555 [Patescibacteria group bacterium]